MGNMGVGIERQFSKIAQVEGRVGKEKVEFGDDIRKCELCGRVRSGASR